MLAAALGLVGVVSITLFLGSIGGDGYPTPITVDGQTINFTWTDDNMGENLHIFTDKRDYNDGLSHAVVYVAVANRSNRNQSVELQAFFRDGSKRIKDVSVLTNVTQNIDEPVYTEQCSTQGTTTTCGQVQTGTTTRQVTKAMWAPLSLVERTAEEITKEDSLVSPGTRKTVENFIGSTKTIAFPINRNEVVYYKVFVEFPAKAQDNFYFEAIGSDGAYGHLDPWFNSSWLYRVKVEVAPSKVGTTSAITNFPVYVNLANLPEHFAQNVGPSGRDIRVTESDGSTETAFELVYISTSTQTWVTETFEVIGTTTWTAPSHVTSAIINVWGGGGGSGDGLNTGGGGGGGGAFASTTLTINPGSTYTLYVASGGGRGPTGFSGSSSPPSYFLGSSTVLAAGGQGGQYGSAVNPAGGAGGSTANSIGSTTFAGGAGASGNNTGDLGGGGGAAAGTSTTGAAGSGVTPGAASQGGGVGGRGAADGQAGSAGGFPGGGAGGGESQGGVGGRGLITITYATTSRVVGEGELHLLADSLSTTSTSTFYIYYGNPSASTYSATSTYGRNKVWASTYQNVWHGQHTSGNLTDSTAQSLTLINTTGKSYARSLLGSGIDFGPDTRNTTEFTTTTVRSTLGNLTFSMWFKHNASVLASFNPSLFQLPYKNAAGDSIQVYPFEENGTTSLRIMRRTATDVVASTTYAAAPWQWYHVAVVYNNSTNRLFGYLNGNDFITTNVSSSGTFNSASYPVSLGGSFTANNAIGLVDEVRVSTTTLSQAWLLTEYNNQSSPSTFYLIGAVESETATGGGAQVVNDIIWFE